MATNMQGAAVTFGTTGWTPELMTIGGITETVNDIETTNLSTTGGRTYQAGSLKEGGTVEFSAEYDDGDVPALGTSETITITWSDTSTTAFTGYINSRTIGGADVSEDSKVMINVIVKVAGTVTNTAA